MNFLSHSSPLQYVHSALFPGIKLWVKRDDLLHPQVSGNKFRKLKYPLLSLKDDLHRHTIVSMGGFWSNHLHALAHAGRLSAIQTIGLVRGLRDHSSPLSACLRDCMEAGMQLHFLSRLEYRQLRDNPSAWQRWVDRSPSEYLWLPEGGSSSAAVRGVSELVAEILEELEEPPEQIILACGTGATLAGVVAGVESRSKVIGIAAVQNTHYLPNDVDNLLSLAGFPPAENFRILHNFTHGGFAKTSPDLLKFCDEFSSETLIPIEPVYTGKMFYALHQLCLMGEFKPSEKIVAIHTGGLQGKRGFI
jgi:1-aminocyclopropane-1-carboxylate deaminase